MNRPTLDRFVLVPVLAVSGALLLASAAAAQGTPADYARAQKLRATYESLAVDIAGPATAIGNTHRYDPVGMRGILVADHHSDVDCLR